MRLNELDSQAERNARLMKRARQREEALMRELRTLEGNLTSLEDERVKTVLLHNQNAVLSGAALKKSAERMHGAAMDMWQHRYQMRKKQLKADAGAKVGHGGIDPLDLQQTLTRLHEEDTRKRAERRRSAKATAIRRIEAEQLVKLSAVAPAHKTAMLHTAPNRYGQNVPTLAPTRMQMLGGEASVLALSDAEWRRVRTAERAMPEFPREWCMADLPSTTGVPRSMPPCPPIYANAEPQLPWGSPASYSVAAAASPSASSSPARPGSAPVRRRLLSLVGDEDDAPAPPSAGRRPHSAAPRRQPR